MAGAHQADAGAVAEAVVAAEEAARAIRATEDAGAVPSDPEVRAEAAVAMAKDADQVAPAQIREPEDARARAGRPKNPL